MNDIEIEIRRCIRADYGPEPRKTLCGKNLGGWCFESIDHWFFSRLQNGRLLGCEQCIAAVKAVIDNEPKREADHG